MIQDPRFPGDEVSRGGAAFFISEIEVLGSTAAGAPRQPLRIVASQAASRTEAGYPAEAVFDGDPATALSFVRKVGGGVALQFAGAWRGGPGATLTVRIRHADNHPYQNLGRFRLSLHTLPEPGPYADAVPDNC